MEDNGLKRLDGGTIVQDDIRSLLHAVDDYFDPKYGACTCEGCTISRRRTVEEASARCRRHLARKDG